MARRVNASASLLAAALGLLQAGSAAALGLGELRLNSFLNEPLDAEVALLDTGGLVADDIRVRLAEVEDFDRLGVEREYFLTSIEFDVVVDSATGQGLIRLSTEEPVVEPFLDFIVEARWPAGRLLREYTVLIDPPAFREEALTVSASERVAEAEGPDPAAPEAAEEAQAADAMQAGEGVVVSGDRVRVLDSDLGPGEMPARSFSAETVETPAPGSRYMVKRDQNLWQIASEGRPDGVSVQQAMLDIQRLNPEAFIGGNINRIKAGYIIYLPSEADISSDDLADALAEVQAQNRAWAEGGRAPPGVTAAATLRISATGDRAAPAPAADSETAEAAEDAGTGAPTPREAAPPPVDAVADAGTGAAEAEAPAERVEDGPASAGASAELGAQLAAMGERLDALEEMLSVKDAEIARLQLALQDAEAEAARAAAAAAAARAPAPQAAGSAAGGGGLMPWLYGVGAALVLALLAVLGLRRLGGRRPPPALAARSGPEEGDDVFSGVKLQGEPEPETPLAATAAPAPAPAEQPEAAPPRNAGERGYGERRYDDYIDDSDGGDALAEADIYIAYGRYLQAAELLGSAIRTEPENTAYRLKLMELYVDMGEDEKAREQLEALREHGSADAIERGERLVGGGRGRTASRAAPPPPAPAPEPEPEPEPGSPSVESPVPPPTPVSPGGPAPATAAGDGVDWEPPETPPAASGSPEPEEPAQHTFDDFGDEPTRPEAEPEEPSPPAFSLDEEAGDEAELSLDDEAVHDDGPALEEGMEELSIDEEPAVESLEDELDFTAPLSNPVSSDEAVDLGDVPRDFAFDTGAGDDEDSTSENGNGDGELVFAEDADQMATRLDLARAYLDMGDSEGARSILEEVARGGDEAQQTEARALLDRLG